MTETGSKSAPDVSRSVQNLAILCRTTLVLFVAWIVLRLTWPSDFWASRLTELTVGGLVFGIVGMVVSLAFAIGLFRVGVGLPQRSRQTDWWCHWWMGWTVAIASAYAIAGSALTKPAGTGINRLWHGIAAF